MRINIRFISLYDGSPDMLTVDVPVPVPFQATHRSLLFIVLFFFAVPVVLVALVIFRCIFVAGSLAFRHLLVRLIAAFLGLFRFLVIVHL